MECVWLFPSCMQSLGQLAIFAWYLNTINKTSLEISWHIQIEYVVVQQNFNFWLSKCQTLFTFSNSFGFIQLFIYSLYILFIILVLIFLILFYFSRENWNVIVLFNKCTHINGKPWYIYKDGTHIFESVPEVIIQKWLLWEDFKGTLMQIRKSRCMLVFI